MTRSFRRRRHVFTGVRDSLPRSGGSNVAIGARNERVSLSYLREKCERAQKCGVIDGATCRLSSCGLYSYAYVSIIRAKGYEEPA